MAHNKRGKIALFGRQGVQKARAVTIASWQLPAASFVVLALLSKVVLAEAADNETREVEIGAGGNIKLEKPYRTEIEAQFDWHAHLLWESRYVTEGRDNLSGNGIGSLSSEIQYRNITIVPWLAAAGGEDYSEFNLNIVYGMPLPDNIELFVGYNHIRSREDGTNANDNEISLDIAYLLESRFQLLASLYHSFDANGEFAELAVKKNFFIADAVALTVRGIAGFNAGYVVDGHRGLNHGQMRMNLSYQLAEEAELYAYAGYNRAINSDSARYAGDALLHNFFWGGVGLTSRF